MLIIETQAPWISCRLLCRLRIDGDDVDYAAEKVVKQENAFRELEGACECSMSKEETMLGTKRIGNFS